MAQFYLTQRALLDLIEIEEHSIEKWGQTQTDIYMSEMYQGFESIARNPDIGLIRKARSFPFHMARIGKHFAVYKSFENYIVIATILHSKQNIEVIIKGMSYVLAREIDALT
jgi:toxin ParE1/3/4